MKISLSIAIATTLVLIGCQPSGTAPSTVRPAPAEVRQQPTAVASPAIRPLASIAYAQGSTPGFAFYAGGETRDQRIEVRADTPARCRIEFVPLPGQRQFWYYRWCPSAPIAIGADDAVVLEARVRIAAEGRINPRTEIRLCDSHDIYADSSRQRRLHNDSVTTFAMVPNQEGWQTIVSRPMQSAADADGHYVLTGLFIGVVQPDLDRRMELEIASLVLRPASATELVALHEPPPLLRGHPGRSYPVQDAAFHYGVWGNLWVGGHPWHPYLEPVPRRELELCNLEIALEANVDTMWSPRVFHPALGPANADVGTVDEVIRLAHTAAEYGISTIATTYLSQYYAPEVPLEKCAQAVRETVSRLKDEPGIIAYYALDEPKLDERTQTTWLWAKDTFGAVDPTRPVLGCLETRNCVRTYAYTDHTPLMDVYPLEGGLLGTTGGDPMVLSKSVDLALANGSHSAWVITQAFGTSFLRGSSDAGFRLPSPAELRLMAWSSMAHGARGVLYFCLQGFGLCHGLEDREGVVGIFGGGYSPLPGSGVEAVALGARIPILGPALIGTQRDLSAERLLGPGSPADPIEATWQSGSDWDVLMVYNRDVGTGRTRSLAVPASLRRDRGIYRLATGERIDRPDGGITVELQPGDGDLLLVADAAGIAKALAGVERRRADTLARRLRFRAIEAAANHIAVPPGIMEMHDPAALAAAATALDAACAGDAVFTGANAALRRMQPIITEAERLMTLHVAATYPRYDAPALAAMRDWNRQVVRCSGIYVLLRNALYAGRAAEVQPLAEAAGVLAEQLRAQAAAGTFALVDRDVLEKIYRACLTLRGL